MLNKRRYQDKIMLARTRLRKGLMIEAYEILGQILTDMEK